MMGWKEERKDVERAEKKERIRLRIERKGGAEMVGGRESGKIVYREHCL